MIPLRMLWAYKELVALALMLAMLGVQTYRLQGRTAERDVLALEKSERIQRDGMRDMANHRNKERTDEEYAAARSRAAAVLVRSDAPGVVRGQGIKLAGGSDGAPFCFDRGRLNEELAGWVERHAAGISSALADIAQLGNRRFTTVAREGEGVAAAYRSCRGWALNLVEAEPLYQVGDRSYAGLPAEERTTVQPP